MKGSIYRIRAVAGLLLWAGSLLLPACTRPAPDGAPQGVASADSVQQGGDARHQEDAWRRVSVAEAGLSFDVPETWPRLGGAWTWSPDSAGATLVGFTWDDAGPGWQPTGMLPDRAEILEKNLVNLRWHVATRYVVRGPRPAAEAGVPAPVEMHVIVEDSARERALDFYASAPDEASLAGVAPVLEHLARSVRLESGGRPR